VVIDPDDVPTLIGAVRAVLDRGQNVSPRYRTLLPELHDALRECRASATSSGPGAGVDGLVPLVTAAFRLKVPPSTLRKRIERGAVPGAQKVGRDRFVPIAYVINELDRSA
jgi:hypothetical protein